ncbi:hypothetical protein C0992_011105 [Termitomyces sp. T32_za158]|nr:hypothetical protein C0992_011105 [Termitomyces sp. T32_za158]
MGQNSSRQRPSSSSAASASSTSAADPQSPSQPTAPAPAEPVSSRRRSVRNSLLNLVRPLVTIDKQPRNSRSRRSSRRWSKAPELPDPTLPEQSSESSSSSSATLPLGPIDEKAERGEHLSDDDVHSHDLQGETSSSPASSSDQTSPTASLPLSESTDVDDSTSIDNLDAQEAPAPLAATPMPNPTTETAEDPAPPTNTPQHQFPPPGTLVVVQGVVHTTDVPRHSTPSLQVPDPTPRSSSTPPSTRNRLSALLQSRPSSRASFTPSSSTLDTQPLSDDPAPPVPETVPSTASSIPLLENLTDPIFPRSVAAAATAASLLTGTTEPLHLPSNIANSPSASPESPAPRPTSPTPTSGFDTTRAERLRQAWGGIRERLGLRPHPSTTPPSSFTPGTDAASDPREHLFGQMARAFNLGFGLGNENTSVGSRDSTANSSNPEGANDANTTGVTPAEPPAEGSFERFLLDLQTDLRAALSSPSAPTDTTSPTSPAEPDLHTTEPDSEPEELLSSHVDEDDGLYGDMPPLGEVSDSESESGNDIRDDTPSAPSSSTPTAARNWLPDIDAEGRINWWRLYRFAPIIVPPNAQSGQGIPTALLPSSQSTNSSTHSPTPPQPTITAPPLPPDPTLSELPFFDDILEVPESHVQAQAHTVVPVIVVGVQSVVAGGWPQATGATSDTENTGTGAPEELPPVPEAVPTESNRGRGWHSRAAEAIRNLRPGRRNRTATLSNAGSRTFLIYVIGGYYPPNHSILNGGPETLASLEALLELADLLGNSKSPTVTKEDIQKSGLEIVKAAQLQQYEREDRISYNCTERCLICLDDYQSDEDIRVMKCRHAFHQNCVDKWLETGRNNCPACRSKGVSLDGTTDA